MADSAQHIYFVPHRAAPLVMGKNGPWLARRVAPRASWGWWDHHGGSLGWGREWLIVGDHPWRSSCEVIWLGVGGISSLAIILWGLGAISVGAMLRDHPGADPGGLPYGATLGDHLPGLRGKDDSSWGIRFEDLRG